MLQSFAVQFISEKMFGLESPQESLLELIRYDINKKKIN